MAKEWRSTVGLTSTLSLVSACACSYTGPAEPVRLVKPWLPDQLFAPPPQHVFTVTGDEVMPGYLPVMPGYLPVMPGYLPVMPGYLPVMPGYLPVMPGYLPVMSYTQYERLGRYGRTNPKLLPGAGPIVDCNS